MIDGVDIQNCIAVYSKNRLRDTYKTVISKKTQYDRKNEIVKTKI